MRLDNPRTGIKTSFHERKKGMEPVILIHGLSGNYTRWQRAAELLAGDYRIIDYDLRGHGESDKGPGLDYGFDSHVEDLAGLMDALGIEKATLAGHSMGGMIAQYFALKYPERVERLVLVATAACMMPGFMRGLAGRFAAWLARAFPSLIATIIRRKNASKPRELFPEFDHPELNFDAFAVAHCFAAIMYMDIRDRLKGLAFPTLVISSTTDELVEPALVRRLADMIPGSCFVSIENHSHYVPLEKPAEVAAAIDGFTSEPKACTNECRQG